MARIRTIKPDFWDDEDLSKLPYACRLFFIGMWTHADDYGVIKANPTLLKSKIFPYDEALRVGEVSKWLDALVNARMLIPISHKDESYYVIRTFRTHQKFDPRYPNFLIDKDEIEEILAHVEHTKSTQRVPNGNPPRDGEGERDGVMGKVKGKEEDCATIVSDLKEGVVGGEWRKSFDAYLSGLRQAYTNKIRDAEFIAEQQRYHPGVNIVLSLEKACKEYWAKEAGWKKKKASKSDTIDWTQTFVNALNLKSNLVYEQRNNQNSAREAKQASLDNLVEAAHRCLRSDQG